MTDSRNITICRLTAALIGAIVLFASAVHADTIELRDGASVRTASVTLGDVADLHGADAVALSDVKLGDIGRSGSRTFTLAEIRSTLDAQNVHWGKLDLQGPMRLTVRRATPDKPAAPDVTAAANPLVSIDAKSPVIGHTLRELVIDRIRQRAGRAASDDSLRITCAAPDDAAWNMTDAQYRFEIDPAASQTLGRIGFNVRCYRDDQLDSVQRLTADVALKSQVIVTTKQLQRGQILTPSDLTRQTLWLDSDRVHPAAAGDDDLKAAVGLVTTRLLRSGAIVQADDIAPRLLVERGQLVTVRAVSGGIVVKFTARAAEDGAAGQLIEARNPKTRETYSVKVTGPQETEMQIASAEPAASTAPAAPAVADNRGKDVAP